MSSDLNEKLWLLCETLTDADKAARKAALAKEDAKNAQPEARAAKDAETKQARLRVITRKEAEMAAKQNKAKKAKKMRRQDAALMDAPLPRKIRYDKSSKTKGSREGAPKLHSVRFRKERPPGAKSQEERDAAAARVAKGAAARGKMGLVSKAFMIAAMAAPQMFTARYEMKAAAEEEAGRKAGAEATEASKEKVVAAAGAANVAAPPVGRIRARSADAPHGGGQLTVSCSFGCGAMARSGSAMVSHYSKCTKFAAHEAASHLTSHTFSDRDAALAFSRKIASSCGLTTRGDRFFCACAYNHPSTVSTLSPQRVFPQRPSDDAGTHYLTREAARGSRCGARRSLKCFQCEASMYIRPSGAEWEVLQYDFHSHPPMGGRGMYSMWLKSAISDAVARTPSISAAALAAQLQPMCPAGSPPITVDAVRMHMHRLSAPLRPPAGRPCVLQTLDLAVYAKSFGGTFTVKLADATVFPPPSKRDQRPQILSHGDQLSKEFYKRFGGQPLASGQVIALFSDPSGLNVFSKAEAICIDKVHNFGTHKDLNMTLVVAYREDAHEPADDATRTLLDSAAHALGAPVADVDAAARRALDDARAAASADVIVGRAPMLVAIILATRADACTTFYGLCELRRLALAETKSAELSVVSLLQDADSADALAAAAALPSLRWVFRCVWHLITSAIKRLGPAATRGLPSQKASLDDAGEIPDDAGTRFTKADALAALSELAEPDSPAHKKARLLAAPDTTDSSVTVSFSSQCENALTFFRSHQWRSRFLHSPSLRSAQTSPSSRWRTRTRLLRQW